MAGARSVLEGPAQFQFHPQHCFKIISLASAFISGFFTKDRYAKIFQTLISRMGFKDTITAILTRKRLMLTEMKHSSYESPILPIMITTDLCLLHPQTDSVSGVYLAVMDFWQFTGSFRQEGTLNICHYEFHPG